MNGSVYGENFKYTKDAPFTYRVSMTPADSNGDLLHDDRVEVKGTGTMK